VWIADGRGQWSYIGGPHFGTLPEKPASYAGFYKYTVQAPGLEGKSALGQA